MLWEWNFKTNITNEGGKENFIEEEVFEQGLTGDVVPKDKEGIQSKVTSKLWSVKFFMGTIHLSNAIPTNLT